MQVELPEEILHRVRKRAGNGVSEVDVIRNGLDALDRLDQERLAIQVGIDAAAEGRVRDFDEFAREFRERNGIAARG